MHPTLTPNSSSPDILHRLDGVLCMEEPELNLPCTLDTNANTNYVGSRSRHPEGVEMLLFDGSVRFVVNDVDLLTVWRPLATIDGGEAGY